MSAIRIVTDSTSDIPQELREALGIEMVPLKVHFGEETYLDGVTLTPEAFYHKLSEARTLPTTSQPSPAAFLEVYNRLAAEEPGVQILSIHLSSTFSGTYQSANLAKSMVEGQADITLVDSLTATYGIGMMVVAAARAAQEGQSVEQILELVGRLRRDMSLFFLVDTLEYLQKGGRIGKASAVLGTLLNIKPILSIDDEGSVYSVDKVRGSKRAVERIIDLLKERHQGPVQVTIAHTACLPQAEELGARLQEHFEIRELLYTTIGPVIGTHVGGGTIGLFMVPVQ